MAEDNVIIHGDFNRPQYRSDGFLYVHIVSSKAHVLCSITRMCQYVYDWHKIMDGDHQFA